MTEPTVQQFPGERMEVRRAIAASPTEIFDLVRDPMGHVAIDASGMLMAATGRPAEAVGDRFVIHMDREALNDFPLGLYDVEIEIVEFVRDRRIAWTIHGQIQPPIGHVYGYDLEPVAHDEGPATMVTSFYDWSRIDPVWRERDIFPIIPESALRATLGILARNVAPGRRRPLLD